MAKPSCLHPILHSARTRNKITTWDGLMVVYLENLKWVSDVIRFRDDNSVVGQNIAQKWEQSWRHGTLSPLLMCIISPRENTGSIDRRYVSELIVYKINLNLMLLHYANTHSTHNTSMGVNVMIGVNYP